jgi:uncharacterized protein (DUF433 family)
MSRIVNLRLKDEQMERLRRLSRSLGRTPSETGVLVIEEALRRAEFAFIDFRHPPVGRQAYLQGTGLAVWEVVQVAQGFGLDAARTAAHLELPLNRVQAALDYAAAYQEEIDAAILENEALDFEALSRLLPGIVRFRVGDDDALPPTPGEELG